MSTLRVLSFFSERTKRYCLQTFPYMGRLYLLLSLAQRKKQRDIHPNQAFPYMGRM